MTGIDPTTCKPGPYRVVSEGLDCDAFRLSHKSQSDWLIQKEHDLHLQTGHYGITVLHRLVPEPKEKTLDVPMQPWGILRAAADVVIADGFAPTELRTVFDVEDYLVGQAGRLEAEHRAAQEKAEQDAAREALIEKAAQSIALADPDGGWGMPEYEHERETYRVMARALADAGLLTEPGDES